MSGMRAALMLFALQATTAAPGLGQRGPASLDLRTRIPGYGTSV